MLSFKIARIFGINVRIHILFVIFFSMIVLLEGIQYGILAAFTYGIFMLFVFGFVLLHELGHSIVALYYHIPVRDITLWPLGGIATMETLPHDPKIEIQIALAGPLINFIVAIILSPLAIVAYLLANSLFLGYLVFVNMTLMLFNLLPAFPMDGGRIYRAWQAYKYDYLTATRKAVKLGSIVAVVLGCLGIVGNGWLLFIAFFIILAGQEELAFIEQQYSASSWNLGENFLFPVFFYESYKSPQVYDSFFRNREREEVEDLIQRLWNRYSWK